MGRAAIGSRPSQQPLCHQHITGQGRGSISGASLADLVRIGRPRLESPVVRADTEAMKNIIALLVIAGTFLAVPAVAAADPVLGDRCELVSSVSGEIVQGVIVLDDNGQLVCQSEDGERSSWGRSSWGF